MAESHFDKDPQIVQLRDEIASRDYNIIMNIAKKTGIGALVGATVGGIALQNPSGAFGGVIAGALGGEALSMFSTIPEVSKLQTDKDNLNSLIQAKNLHNEFGNSPIPAPVFAGLAHNQNDRSHT